MQNVWEYEDTKIVTTPVDNRLHACKFKLEFTIFDESLASIHHREKVEILDRPVYGECAIHTYIKVVGKLEILLMA